jgi:hypothetical protein
MSVETDINLLIERARAAQQIIECYTQEQVDELIRAMVWSVARACAAAGAAISPPRTSPGATLLISPGYTGHWLRRKFCPLTRNYLAR